MASPGSSPGMEPLIILTFTCGGTELLRAALAHDPELAFTSSTGMLPLCRQAVMVWNRAEGHRKAAASVLARKSVFVMLSAQISVILAGAGKKRWCETAVSATECAESFLEIFPRAKFICFYRSCAGMVSEGMNSGFGDILTRERGFSDEVNCLASYWTHRAESLLAFESAHPDSCQRVRYEDLESRGPDAALRALDRLTMSAGAATRQAPTAGWSPILIDERLSVPAAAEIAGLANRIAPQLRERIEPALSELAYAPLA